MTLREILTWLWEKICPRVTLHEERSAVAGFSRKHTAGWTTEDERREAGLYAANPLAFWLRPDRHEHGVPCWMVEGDYQPPAQVRSILNDFVSQSYLLAQQQNQSSALQQATNAYAQQYPLPYAPQYPLQGIIGGSATSFLRIFY